MPMEFGDWLAGFCVLKISGGGQERFLNLALQRGIELWDSEWQEDDVLAVKAARRDVKELRSLAKSCGCNLGGAGGRGLPFVCGYLRGRKTLPIGVALFAAGLVAVSQVVWAVNVVPEEELHELDLSRVERLADELGVKRGAIWWRLDTDEIAERLADEIPEISWVYVERQGTVANIKVAERSIYPEKLENATLGAIYANRDALVEEVLIKHGEAVAEHGNTVQVGDVLVKPLGDGRADAIVNARVWYDGYGEAAQESEIYTPTGEVAAVWRLLRPDGGELLLWGREPDPKAEQRVVSRSVERTVAFWGTEFCLRRDELAVEDVAVVRLSDDEARAAAYQAALGVIYAQQNAESRLLNEVVEYELLDGVWRCSVVWECFENIGEHQK